MSKRKKLNLKDLDNTQLILEFQIAIRRAWDVFNQQPQKVALKSPERHEELRVRRELVRRLKMIPPPIKPEESFVGDDGGGLFSGGGTDPGGGLFSKG